MKEEDKAVSKNQILSPFARAATALRTELRQPALILQERTTGEDLGLSYDNQPSHCKRE